MRSIDDRDIRMIGTAPRTSTGRAARAPGLRLGLLLLALLGPAAVRAQGQEPGAPPAPARLWLDEVLLSRCDLVITGRLEKSSRLGNGQRVDRVSVSRVLLGEAEGHVLIAAGGAVDLSAGGTPKLLFLRRSEGRALCTLVDLVDLPEVDAKDRVDFVRRALAARNLEPRRRRLEGFRDLVLFAAASPSPWVRRILCHEIARIAETTPRLIDGGGIAALRGVPSRDLPSAERLMLHQAVLDIEKANAVGWTGDRLTFGSEEDRRAFLRDLAAFQRGREIPARREFLDRVARSFGARAAPLFALCIEDSQPEIRRHGIWLLGELESGAGLRGLLELMGRSDAPEDRLAVLEALEKIAPVEAVPALIAAAGRPEDRERALRALAAINTGEAALYLETLDERLRGDPESPVELRLLVAHLRSDAFRRELAEARDERRRRWSGDAPEERD